MDNKETQTKTGGNPSGQPPAEAPIRVLAEEHFCDSRQTMDWYHATEHLGQTAYFEHNQQRMNYLELREEGRLIGSGMAYSLQLANN